VKTTKELKEDLTHYLNDNPHMKPLQQTIDNILAMCHTQEARAALSFEMWMDSKGKEERLTDELIEAYNERARLISLELERSE